MPPDTSPTVTHSSKEVAIISLLWSTHLPILLDYLTHLPDTRPRTIFLLACIAETPEDIKKIEALGVTIRVIESPLSDLQKQTINQYHNQALVQLTRCFRSAHWKTFCQRCGAPFTETTATISKLLTQNLSRIEIYLTWLEKIRQDYFVEVLLSSEDVLTLARTTILWAKKANIPSVHIQHGPQLSQPPPIHDQDFADYMSVYGQRAVDAHAGLGFQRSKIAIAGNHCWDVHRRYGRHKGKMRHMIDQQYQLKPQPLVLFGTTWVARLLSAHIDSEIHAKTLSAVFGAFKQLQARNINITLVIKDRAANVALLDSAHVTATLATQCGLKTDEYLYTTADAAQLVSAADVLISCDSTLSIEAMHTLTPAINLNSEWPMMLGSSFHAEDGILSVCEFNATHLADRIEALLFDKTFRAAQIDKMVQHAPLYNVTAHDGNALTNITSVITNITQRT